MLLGPCPRAGPSNCAAVGCLGRVAGRGNMLARSPDRHGGQSLRVACDTVGAVPPCRPADSRGGRVFGTGGRARKYVSAQPGRARGPVPTSGTRCCWGRAPVPARRIRAATGCLGRVAGRGNMLARSPDGHGGQSLRVSYDTVGAVPPCRLAGSRGDRVSGTGGRARKHASAQPGRARGPVPTSCHYNASAPLTLSLTWLTLTPINSHRPKEKRGFHVPSYCTRPYLRRNA